MASILGITEQRVQQLTLEGMPKLGRGAYPLKACVQWYIAYWRDKAEGRGNNPVRSEGEELNNLLKRAKLQEATGHLIHRKEVMDKWASTFMRLGKWLDGLPSSLARAANLNAETTKLIRERLDEAREDFAKDSVEYLSAEEHAKAKRQS